MRAADHRAHALLRAASSTLVVGSVVVSLLVSGTAVAAPPLGVPEEVRAAHAEAGLADAASRVSPSLGTFGASQTFVASGSQAALVTAYAASMSGGSGAASSLRLDPSPGSGASTAADAHAPGDLRSPLEDARARREAAPGVDTALAEADACEALGDYACAKAALQDVIEDPNATQAQRDDATARLEALEEASRGRNLDAVAPEPESTHRDRIDAERAERLAALNPPPPPPPEPVKDKPERIVRKWYFWVTVAAIGAAAGAITGIAVKAATDERRDSLDAGAGGSAANTMGPALIRF